MDAPPSARPVAIHRFREQVRLFLVHAGSNGRCGVERDFVPRCLEELRSARAAQALTRPKAFMRGR